MTSNGRAVPGRASLIFVMEVPPRLTVRDQDGATIDPGSLGITHKNERYPHDRIATKDNVYSLWQLVIRAAILVI